jgi:tetratricopeptide (TPR) repeat protein
LIKRRITLTLILVAAVLAALFFVTQKFGQSSAVQERPAQPLAKPPLVTTDLQEAPDVAHSAATPSVEVVSKLSLPDYQSVFDHREISPELRETLRNAYIAFSKGNLDHAAHLSLDALELSDSYPAIRPTIYSLLGLCYEKLGYFDMAMEQYWQALSLYPEHRASYKAMRRLDPQFAETHPALAKQQVQKSTE